MPAATEYRDDANFGGAKAVREEESSPEDLISYKKTEFGCVADLRRLLDLASKIHIGEPILALTREVLKRVETKCFTIAVVGEFKRGKSTFINALLGREILPANVLPTTATLNRITYGSPPRVSIHYKPRDGEAGRVEEIAIDQLETYVTKLTPESTHNAAQIEEAVIHYPTDYCRNNVDIIDTPGLNDDDTMTGVTLSVIPKVDAAILVIMPEAPFAGTEGDFLTRHLLLQDLGRVMFVVTAIDRLRRPQDRQSIVKVITERIKTAVETRLREQFPEGSEEYNRYRQQIGEPVVFPLSAYNALEARDRNDDKMLEESQFPAFTTALGRFLTHTRGAVELQVLANRILATADEIGKKIKIELGGLDMEHGEFQQAYDSAVDKLENLRRRRDAEIAKIEDAMALTQRRLQPMVVGSLEDLRRAAVEVIDNAKVTAVVLTKEGVPALTERLTREVSEAVKIRALRASEGLQIEIERDIQTEMERLHEFAAVVGSALQGIEFQFGGMEVDTSARPSAGGQALAAAVSAFTGFGGVWSGYRVGGIKGAAIGGAASVGTAVVGGFVAAALGVTVGLPLVIGVGIASIFTGGWMAKRFSASDRAERFVERFRAAILEKLNEELEKRALPEATRKSVQDVYGALRQKVIGEATASIDQMQSTLDDLKSRKTRNEALSERRRQESEEIRQEVFGIRTKALRLSNQLAVAGGV
jgi:GTPase SAR1 family protein